MPINCAIFERRPIISTFESLGLKPQLLRAVAEMGFTEPTPAMLDLPGFKDFFREGLARTRFTGTDTCKARDFLSQFRLGRWRQHVGSE